MEDQKDYREFLSKDSVTLPPSFTTNSQDNNEEQLDIGWVFSVLRRRAAIIIFIAIIIIGSLGTAIILLGRRKAPLYQGYFKLLAEPISAEAQVDRLAISSETLAKNVHFKKDTIDYDSLVRFLKSEQIMRPIIEEMNSKNDYIAYDIVIKNLYITRIMVEDAKPVPIGTKIIDVHYNDENSDRVEFLINKLSLAYLEYSGYERLVTVKNGIKFIEEQLPGLEERANNIKKQIQDVRQRYNVIDPELNTPGLYRQKQLLEEKRLNLETKIANIKVVKANIEKHLDEGNATTVLADRTSAYKILIEQLNNVEGRIAQKSSLLREDSPMIRTLRQQEANLRSLLFAEAQKIMKNIDAELEGLEEEYKVIVTAENILEQQLQELPIAARLYSELQTELKVVNQTLNEFRAKREDFNLKAAQQEVPWNIIEGPGLRRDASGNLKPVGKDNTKRMLALIVVLGSLLSMGSGFLIEVIIQVFHTPKEIQVTTKLSLLGVIPLAKELRRQTIQAKPQKHLMVLGSLSSKVTNFSNLVDTDSKLKLTYSPLVLEAFRSLYTNISLLNHDSSLKSLAISSAMKGDGKSTIAINLAQIAASVGQRVLLVDANLRSPQIHLQLGLPNLEGFSDAISTDIGLNDAIQRSPENENLFILTAGQVPPDPIKLLSSQKRKYLMDQFNAFFDLVIYDTPPLVDLADASLITAHVDGTILVVAIEKTDRSMLTKAIEGLKISDASVLGVVTNFNKR
ncbi:MAG: polysaccharide biosynthesis tyrosine autokinase [Okeania sp. SIO3I5]|uniref:polysaccharide biosynthesis tyrosine autokinase n=1 Tax=Okeania sp. SIO3I5 TaxID=2607805 RepID=UPI0013B8E5D3|nr:polysaccharide biosynthesis tyrosine autokinase [Okeania sp. SIO3I5]NEQ41429.1 polysaccharide biosynthesis tyrosine autokinase [Okeania sp. SIO3I5]